MNGWRRGTSIALLQEMMAWKNSAIVRPCVLNRPLSVHPSPYVPMDTQPRPDHPRSKYRSLVSLYPDADAKVDSWSTISGQPLRRTGTCHENQSGIPITAMFRWTTVSRAQYIPPRSRDVEVVVYRVPTNEGVAPNDDKISQPIVCLHCRNKCIVGRLSL